MSTASSTKIQSDSITFAALSAISESMSADILAEAAATDRTDSFPSATFAKLAENGLLNAVLPRKFGGDGLGIEEDSTFELLTLLKTFGYGNLVVGRIYEGHFNAVQLICEYGDDAQSARFFSEAAQKKHLFGVWNTEAGDGVKIIPIENGKFRLEGAKTFASGIGYVNRPLITGRMPDGGWQMFVLPLDEIDAKVDDSWWRPLGMQATRSYRIDLTNIEINREQLVGAPNDYYLEPFFSGGAIRFAAVQLGAAELLLDLTASFLREINRTNDAFQQMRAGEMAIAVESGNLFLRSAANKFDEFLSAKNSSYLTAVLSYAGMMRTVIERICLDTIERSSRSIGSRGLMENYHFERVIRDLTMYLRQAAPDATLVNIGKFVLESKTTNSKIWDSRI